jgi:hypothetical protein
MQLLDRGGLIDVLSDLIDALRERGISGRLQIFGGACATSTEERPLTSTLGCGSTRM